ncbi:MAG: phosphatidate cytidylyltransferase [Porticoccaceae bacterium]|nr:phosphatidate cytidylyltransferase [Porticoccaceae bacterium]
MLKQRIVTAIILAVLFLGALFGLPFQWFSLVVAGVIFVALWEWANLSNAGRAVSLLYYGVVAVLMAAMFLGLGFDAPAVGLEAAKMILLSGCLWWAIALLWVQGYPSSAVLWGSTAVRLLMGLFVLLPAWLALSWLAAQDGGHWLVMVVIVTVVCADIGAYFSGRAFGRHKLAPEVSPGKTWEGFGGGVVAVLIVISIVIAFSPSQRHLWLEWVIVEVAAVLAAVLGDLLESMVKRHRGVKDSGKILPGHGGILDRIDSLTAALPVFTLFYILLIHSPS